MRTIRRLYFYLVTLISLEVVIWGLVNLLRTTVDLLPGTGSTGRPADCFVALVFYPRGGAER
jgi:hypothetical protein